MQYAVRKLPFMPYTKTEFLWRILRISMAEIFGTGMLLFVGCMGCLKSIAPGGTIPHAQLCFSFGFAVLMAIQTFGHISGGHINPSVTITAVVLGHVPWIMLPVYVLSQCIGSTLGMLLLKLVTPGMYYNPKNVKDPVTGIETLAHGVCSTVPNPNVPWWQCILVEFALTFVLALVCCGVWDHRTRNAHDSLTVRFALTIAGLAMVGGHYTHASMNSARTLGPAIINNDWERHWIYWIGPNVGAAVAPILYRLLWESKIDAFPLDPPELD